MCPAISSTLIHRSWGSLVTGSSWPEMVSKEHEWEEGRSKARAGDVAGAVLAHLATLCAEVEDTAFFPSISVTIAARR